MCVFIFYRLFACLWVLILAGFMQVYKVFSSSSIFVIEGDSYIETCTQQKCLIEFDFVWTFLMNDPFVRNNFLMA